MRVTFRAALQGATVIRFDSDGAGVVKLMIPASELPQVAKLLALTEQLLTVTINTSPKE